MKILILGAGQVGRTAAQPALARGGQRGHRGGLNEEMLRDLQDRLDMRTVAGNAAYPTVLEAAGAAEADIIVALTNSDEVNLVACEVAFTLFRTPTKIARIRSAEYTSRARAVRSDGLCRWTSSSVPSSWSPSTSSGSSTTPARCRCWTSPTARCAWSACARARGGLLVGHRLRELPRAPAATSSCASWRSTATAAASAPDGETVIERRRRGVLPRRQRRHPPRHGRDAPRR